MLEFGIWHRQPTMHDIYDPPPAPDQDFNPPKPDPLIFTRGDFLCLVGLCALLSAVSLDGLAHRARAGPGDGGGRVARDPGELVHRARVSCTGPRPCASRRGG